MLRIFHVSAAIFCLLVASLADAHAVNYATKVWLNDKIQVTNIVKVFAYYVVSIVPFLYSIRFFNYAISVNASLQILIWFLSTVLFVSIIDRSFFGWHMVDQLLGIVLVIGLGYLAIHTQK